MKFYNTFNLNTVNVETIQAEWLFDKKVALDILRLDKIHSVVSGNKWFKLKYYLSEAASSNKTTIATFGGAWSNHIVAVAFACKEVSLQSVGIIRGEKPAVLSATLKKAVEYGMELHFVTREEYRSKETIKQKFADNSWYWINEGGYGRLGAKGASEILKVTDISTYSHIVAAVGSGTMLAGLLLAAGSQKVIGISSMKKNVLLEKEILHLVAAEKINSTLQIIHDYHFGGYGKHPLPLIDFINEVYSQHNLPLDIVYTGKTFYAIKDLTEKDFFEPGSRVLMIHSGGLQGNASLPLKVLAF
ncbi:1-aminocyclopropane-1-carboxylate deaminase/D-cysteine desulfhydrase [Segetibacter koreensis]|uniref:1-aminocyclopropane-1-carboxylate deaminase/D-cysteine desulfhydrase n=1 Tax=Segetibacter koreensis TaxID=398037 RepID=UPI000371E361|nr:pyridoxal-phosphate dependent enzyme [Segetibacter koreensis]